MKIRITFITILFTLVSIFTNNMSGKAYEPTADFSIYNIHGAPSSSMPSTATIALYSYPNGYEICVDHLSSNSTLVIHSIQLLPTVVKINEVGRSFFTLNHSSSMVQLTLTVEPFGEASGSIRYNT